MFLCQIGGPNGPIWGGGVPHATQVTQAFGLGREVVGCASGDALWVSRKRDDQLRASWHTLVPSAEVLRAGRQQRPGGVRGVVQVRIFRVSAQVWEVAGLRVWVDWGRVHIFAEFIRAVPRR